MVFRTRSIRALAAADTQSDLEEVTDGDGSEHRTLDQFHPVIRLEKPVVSVV